MFSLYDRWNRGIKRVLWTLTILGVLSSLPFIFIRSGVEQTAEQVEIVFDYRDLLEVSSYRNKPSEYMLSRLLELKEAGVTSMAVYESSLRELELSGRIQTMSSAEAALLTEFGVSANKKSTYVLFLGSASERMIRPIVESAFARLGVEIKPWNFRGIDGIELSMPKDEASLQALDPDPITMAELQALGFQLVVRLSDQRQPFHAETMDALLGQLADRGIKRIIFEGDAVTGAADDSSLHSLTAMAELMKKHGLGMAVIELSKPQAGFNKLAFLTDYNVVRLHSLPAGLSGMAPEDLADRFALAVQDRNIRMIFLNVQASLDASLGIRKDTVANVVNAMKGEHGAVARIQDEGFTIGPAEPFQTERGLPSIAELLLKALVTVGAVALIALLIAGFFPSLGLLAFGGGLAGSAALYVLSTTLLSQGLALGAGIAASTLAIMIAIQRADAAKASGGNIRAVGYALKLLAAASVISFIGIIYIVALLDHTTYYYVLEQYRGVSLLHLAPIALSLAYVLFFHGQSGILSVVRRVVSFLNMNVTVLWVAVAGVGALAVLYYLSRTGNAGQTSDLERLFRATLQDVLGVRPRTKEFLFAHPIFIAGVYLVVRARHKLGLLLIAVASIGQLSIVDTFAHLHTPLIISLIRVVYGLAFGAVIGIVLAAIVMLAERGWARWARLREEL